MLHHQQSPEKPQLIWHLSSPFLDNLPSFLAKIFRYSPPFPFPSVLKSRTPPFMKGRGWGGGSNYALPFFILPIDPLTKSLSIKWSILLIVSYQRQTLYSKVSQDFPSHSFYLYHWLLTHHHHYTMHLNGILIFSHHTLYNIKHITFLIIPLNNVYKYILFCFPFDLINMPPSLEILLLKCVSLCPLHPYRPHTNTILNIIQPSCFPVPIWDFCPSTDPMCSLKSSFHVPETFNQGISLTISAFLDIWAKITYTVFIWFPHLCPESKLSSGVNHFFYLKITFQWFMMGDTLFTRYIFISFTNFLWSPLTNQ